MYDLVSKLIYHMGRLNQAIWLVKKTSIFHIALDSNSPSVKHRANKGFEISAKCECMKTNVNKVRIWIEQSVYTATYKNTKQYYYQKGSQGEKFVFRFNLKNYGHMIPRLKKCKVEQW